MFTIKGFLLLSAVVLLDAHHLPTNLHVDNRIIGGNDTTIEAAPWQISLQKQGWHICGGSIYSKNIIVTAAHCVQGESPDVLTVRVGATNNKNDGKVIRVRNYIEHEQHNQPKFANDIAVIRLVDDIIFSASAQPIELARKAPADDASARVTGWGFTNGGILPDILQSVDVRIVSKQSCQQIFGGQVTGTMICAGRPGETVCSGDSGGPLVVNGELVGVVSWAAGDCSTVGVFADVADLRNWIEEKANSLS
ncbi:trypsin alpha-like [Scaptodrosophila lebanonensis]|uniref:trypsin n=1 Tax=Drosophila lebanonensis TaxID=7225 RepID=A0A6J2U6J1_DROLE|nr:trypsin alpha-like [Scaptodrosophila lebanonensis]